MSVRARFCSMRIDTEAHVLFVFLVSLKEGLDVKDAEGSVDALLTEATVIRMTNNSERSLPSLCGGACCCGCSVLCRVGRDGGVSPVCAVKTHVSGLGISLSTSGCSCRQSRTC